MRYERLVTASFVLLTMMLCGTTWAKELDGFLGEIDVRASADLGAFRADLTATFDVSSGEIDGLFEIFDRPADIYITLRIGEISRVSIDRVVDEYRRSKGQGWGVVAKNLGIKPGSAEFHALKDGRLAPRGDSKKSGKGNGKAKGRD